ncbi:MAG: toll/interleukin-1 receptor domain-containing protein [Chloroflexota bacterium]
MGANIIIYCLEQLTDYFEFERLCTDLMALEGYSSIEPLGGFKDKGRDAVHHSNDHVASIFAYSVRENWRVKLAEDAQKIKKHAHHCDELVFLTTANFSVSERDEAIEAIKDEYGWDLKLYGVERLRVLLEVEHPEILARYPQIFPPNFLSISKSQQEGRKYIFISYAEQDWGLADWLSRKLISEGFFVWCERLKLLGGEEYPRNIDEALNSKTFRVIALYSSVSLQNQELMRQRHVSTEIGKRLGVDFVIPLDVDGIDFSQLDKRTGSLVFIPFTNWGNGLKQLLSKLSETNCPKRFDNGSRIAASAYFGEDLLDRKPENLVLNYFSILSIPKYLRVFEAKEKIPWSELREIELDWAFRKIGSKFYFGFHVPPSSIIEKYAIREIDSVEWGSQKTIQKINSQILFTELLKKSLYVKCHQKGLEFCKDTKLYYFPLDLIKDNRLKVIKLDGTKTFVSSVGQRTYPIGKEIYRYSLSPVFFIVHDVSNTPVVQINVRVRITDSEFRVLPVKKRQSRRKHLCHDWWNQEWLNRTLAISQFLANEEDRIVLGGEEEKFVISSKPFILNSPISISESAIDALMEKRRDVKKLLGGSFSGEDDLIEFLEDLDEDSHE